MQSVEDTKTDIVPWEPKDYLQDIPQSEVRFSRGLFAFDVARYFSTLLDDWTDFWTKLDSEIHFSGISPSFEIPHSISRVVQVEVGGSRAYLSLSTDSITNLLSVFDVDFLNGSEDLVLEYLERRFVSSLTRAWKGKGDLSFSYVASIDTLPEDVACSFSVNFKIKNDIQICLLLTEESAKLISDLALKELKNKDISSGVSSVGVRVSELAVSPATLIDYMRAGTVIDLSVGLNQEVDLFKDGAYWFSGHLRTSAGKYVVQYSAVRSKDISVPASSTKLGIEIARGQVDRNLEKTFLSEKAIFETQTPIEALATLVVGGEDVAQGSLLVIDDERLGIRVRGR